MSNLQIMNKYCLKSLLLRFVLHVLSIIKLNLNDVKIDQRKLLNVKFKQTNQICLSLKIS